MPTPLSLPEPSNEPLANSPLSLVVCEVRHQGGALLDPTGAEKIHQFVKTDFPHVEPALESKVNITAGSEGVATQQTPPRPRWQFRSEDGWVAVLGQTQFALETINYDRWDKFVERLDMFMRSVARISKPKTEERVGLRFINRMDLDSGDKPEHFRGLITDETLGMLADSKLSPSIISTQSMVDLYATDDVSLRLQHGQQLAGDAMWYIVDTDCYRQLDTTFDSDKILLGVESFHRFCKQIFEVVITEQMYKRLRDNKNG